jgi:IS605 OrfB family transposase
MRLTVQVKLVTNEEEKQELTRTLESLNTASNFISQYAWNNRQFKQFSLHKELYYTVKNQFQLSAQHTVRCFAKVSNAYQLDRKQPRNFKSTGAFPFDSRILSWNIEKQQISIRTLNKRCKLSFQCGQRQLEQLIYQQGETDLICRNKEWYLLTTISLPDEEIIEPDDFIGVDMGLANIATLSNGKMYGGGQVTGLRKRHRRLRAKLQSKGTKSAKRLLKKRSKQEHNFIANVNHCISKEIVGLAKRTNCGIAIENLQGIRKARVRKPQRTNNNSWAFYQLRTFIEYKAQLAGIPVKLIDPAFTSQTCSNCGHISKSNRKTQSNFLCQQCGFSAHADHNAALNIKAGALVNRPNVVQPIS